MKYFVIDEFGVKHPYPYEPQSGPIGTTAQTLEYIYTAGADVIRDRVLMLSNGKVVHFEPGDETSSGHLVGFCNQTVAASQPVSVTSAGVRTSAGWGLTPNAVYYAAANGGITTTPPVSGISVRMGVAITASTMRLELSEGVILI